MRQRVLIISTAPPVPVDNGKRMVLSGLLDYFVDRLGADNVHYTLLGARGVARPEFAGVAHRLDPPSTVGQLGTLVGRLARDRSYTAQEAMLGSPALREQIQALIAWLRPTIEVYDTLRMGQHAPTTRGTDDEPARRFLYLDDLFSLRYERMLAFDRDNEVHIDPLGEFATNVPGPLRALVRRPAVYRRVLKMERDRIRRREIEMARRFDTSLLVNPNEVRVLRERAGTQAVRGISGLLPEVTPVHRDPVNPPELLFLGRLNIPHNEDAITTFLTAVMPQLVERLPGVVLRVIGSGASPRLQELAARFGDQVRLEGFVADLEPVFARVTASVAPLRFGTGIKIKMLDTLARGVPVLTTRLGVDGIDIHTDGRDGCLVADDLDQWPELLAEMSVRSENDLLSKAAAAYFDRTFSRRVVMARYDEVFGLAPVPTHQ
ncbi:glycosyltransferase family 4 protein [Micromonospora sp.]|uniref:glycosyltransferase family 4 protein n=1 Tax=Micromonospora sp. TaxID=1876 RepID=UPI003B3A921C